MYKFSQKADEIRVQRQDIAGKLRDQIFELLETSLEIFETLLSDALSRDATSLLISRIDTIKLWIDTVLEAVHGRMEGHSGQENWTPPIRIPEHVARQLLYCIAKVISCGRDFEDNDYYLINRIRLALSLSTDVALIVLEQVQHHNQREDIDRLIQHLDTEQRYNAALLLYKAIQADDKLHPAELKYMQGINRLLGNDEAAMELIEKEGMDADHFPVLNLTEPYADYLLSQLVEIVLCDDEYDPQESYFITRAAEVLGIDPSRREELEQTIATALIAKSTLFVDSSNQPNDP